MEKLPDPTTRHTKHSGKNMAKGSQPRARRKSNGLGSDIRVGDTGAPAVSTLEPMPTIVSPPLTPSNSFSSPSRISKRRKAKSLLRRWRNLSFRHTWVNPLIIVLIVLALYAINPTESNPLHHAIFLSYKLDPSSDRIPAYVERGPDMHAYFGKGIHDFTFVAFYIVVLSFTREFLMQRLIRPWAISLGVRSRSKQSRFMEQAYTAIYFSVFGPYGLYVMSRTPVWYFNTDAMFETYPHYSHDAIFKAYYLLQASYWAQQAIVLSLQLEKPRKDFKELVIHHIVTLFLIGLSYRFHFTYMGLAVYITHDISDFFLATSKTLNYLDSPIMVPYFTLFVASWVYLRHYINLRILWATVTTFKTLGPWELNWETQLYKCPLAQKICFSLLASLQAINLFWLYLIWRIAYNVVFASVIEDVRSDADDSDGEDEAEAVTGEWMKADALNGSLKSEKEAMKGLEERKDEGMWMNDSAKGKGARQEKAKAKANAKANGSAASVKPDESFADAVRVESKKQR